jgi:hypothetical protein
LLDEEAILDRHTDLVAKGEKEAIFSGSKSPAVRCPEKKYAEGMFLGLQADGHDAAKTLRECELAETANGLFALESGDSVVIAKIAETEEATEARDEADKIVVEALFLRRAAEIIA